MTQDHRIGECRACHARFRIPATFRAERARCRECGGVVIIEGAAPGHRSGQERRRSAGPGRGPRDERRDARRDDRRGPAHEAARVPVAAPAPPARATEPAPAARATPAPDKEAVEPAAKKAAQAEPAPPKEKKPGVIASIVTAVFKKKRGKRP